jgi:hypothetical protein
MKQLQTFEANASKKNNEFEIHVENENKNLHGFEFFVRWDTQSTSSEVQRKKEKNSS